MSKQFTLGKNERLKSRKSIEQLFKAGKSFVVSPYRVHYFISKEETQQPDLPVRQAGGQGKDENALLQATLKLIDEIKSIRKKQKGLKKKKEILSIHFICRKIT